MDASSEGPVLDASALCRACAMCCDWSLFHEVELQRSEVPWASSRRLPLLQAAEKVSFRLPCAVLRVDQERVCGDYDHRPVTCRRFECKLLVAYKNGEISTEKAFGTVANARALVDRVEARLAKDGRAGDLPGRLEELASDLEGGESLRRARDPELLLDLAELRTRIWPAFRDLGSRPTMDVSEVRSLADRARNPETWQALLGPMDENLAATGPAPLWEEEADELRLRGYTHLDGAVGAEDASTLASHVTRLEAAGWPAPFLFMHPLAWSLAGRFDPWVGRVLGGDFGLVSSLWVWSLSGGKATRGWHPHRDRQPREERKDGAPHSVTVWIALTDAEPDNGCIYIVPPHYDVHYGTERIDVHDVQNIRALPARQGGALVWNHQVLHWGGRVERSVTPRMSVAFEFERTDAPNKLPTIGRGWLPPFAERLRLVAEQLLRYRRRGVDPQFVELAREFSKDPLARE